MNKTLPICVLMSLCAYYAQAQVFESAQDAVTNMRLGWNLGNRLDANSGDVNNMWIEAWSDRSPSAYETAWGQPVITRDLVHMFKEAGFNAMRVPVTWYPHMGEIDVKVGPNSDGNWVGTWDISAWEGGQVDPVWMARVHEVVDYVIDEGMYCILNVHHDTGDGSIAWLRADMDSYEQYHERFESLWTQIATEFKDYDEHLLFEGYNEMLDKYGSWCFASFYGPNNYNSATATSAYNAINSYAQSFVNAVRATGGNNLSRNLIVNTYGSCSGEGSWNSHLQDPLKKLVIPTDVEPDHIIAQVHYYPSSNNINEARSSAENLVNIIKKHLFTKGVPVIIGEWGLITSSDTPGFNDIYCALADRLVTLCKKEGIGTFKWMGLSDGDDCKVPQWTEPALKDAMVRAYYGSDSLIDSEITPGDTDKPYYRIDGTRAYSTTVPGFYISGDKKILVR